MDEGISKKFAIQLLEDDAERIKMLIRNQKTVCAFLNVKRLKKWWIHKCMVFKTSDLCDPFGDFN